MRNRGEEPRLGSMAGPALVSHRNASIIRIPARVSDPFLPFPLGKRSQSEVLVLSSVTPNYVYAKLHQRPHKSSVMCCDSLPFSCLDEI